MRVVLLSLLAGCLVVDATTRAAQPELWWVQYPGAALAAICTFDGATDCAALVDQCDGCAVTCWPTDPLRHCAPPKPTKETP